MSEHRSSRARSGLRAIGYTGGGLLLAAATVICTSRGCSKPPATVLVVGRLTYNGQPVKRATVTFLSNFRDTRPAFAKTDLDGRYSLKTYLSPDLTLDGAFPDAYTVLIAKARSPVSGLVDDELWRRHCLREGRWGPGDQEEFESTRIDDDDASGTDAAEKLSGKPFSAGFVPPPSTNVESIREILALSKRKLAMLSDEELLRLRMPPDWPRLGWSAAVHKLYHEYAMGKTLVPLRYFAPATSPLKAVVERRGGEPLVFDFELTDEEPPTTSALAHQTP